MQAQMGISPLPILALGPPTTDPWTLTPDM